MVSGAPGCGCSGTPAAGLAEAQLSDEPVRNPGPGSAKANKKAADENLLLFYYCAGRGGAVSAKPVHSQFGWHILQVMESRPAELFPAFDRAKLQIEQNLTRERVNAYVDGLVAKAKIH